MAAALVRALISRARAGCMQAMVDAARWSIGFLWAAAAVLGFAAARRRNALAAFLLLALGLLSASAATLRWHVAVHQAARSWLQDAGLYQQRAWFKALIALALVVIVVAATWLLIHALRELPRALGVALLTMLLWAGYLVAYTAFLDDLLPPEFAHWPLRQVVEGSFVVVTFVSVLVGSRAHAGSR